MTGAVWVFSHLNLSGYWTLGIWGERCWISSLTLSRREQEYWIKVILWIPSYAPGCRALWFSIYIRILEFILSFLILLKDTMDTVLSTVWEFTACYIFSLCFVHSLYPKAWWCDQQESVFLHWWSNSPEVILGYSRFPQLWRRKMLPQLFMLSF